MNHAFHGFMTIVLTTFLVVFVGCTKPQPHLTAAQVEQLYKDVKESRAPVEKLGELAERGDVKGQLFLGKLFQYRPFENGALAIKWFKESAKQGDAEAMHQLGVMYRVGANGVSQDCDEAVKWYEKAARNDGDSAYQLGMMYRYGDCVAESSVLMRMWFKKAAELGDVNAQREVAIRYWFDRDFSHATFWWKKAAEKGDSSAQYRLGDAYHYGEGVIKDPLLAYMWFNLSAAQGDEDSKKARDTLEKQMTPAQIAEAQRLSREWKPKQ